MLASYLEDIRGQKIVQHGSNSTIQTLLPFKHVLGYAVVTSFKQTDVIKIRQKQYPHIKSIVSKIQLETVTLLFYNIEVCYNLDFFLLSVERG